MSNVGAAQEALRWHRSETSAGPGFWATRIFNADYAALREVLIWAACPVVCRGRLDGDENWHQLCIDKADRALAALEVGDA